jgi:hypothetical protein
LHTYEKRGAGFRKIIEFVTAEDMAEDEREDEHLEKDAHSCRLLILSRTTPPGICRRYFILYAHSEFYSQFRPTQILSIYLPITQIYVYNRGL